MSLAIDAVYQIDPAQVGDLNRFGDPDHEPNRLTNDVHSLWTYRNWSRNIRAKNTPRIESPESLKNRITKRIQRDRCKALPTHTFERILPALRLASLFLEKSLPWFWNLRYAPYKGFGRQKQTELQLDEGDWTEEKENQIRRDLEVIAQRYFILHGVYGWDLSATAMSSYSLLNIDADVPEDPNEDAYVVHWQKRAQLMTVVAKESIEFVGSRRWLALPLAIQHRCLFLLASLMMHELAHVVIFYRYDDVLINNEPYFRQSEPAREMGFSWEYYMFGGILTNVDGEFTGNPSYMGYEGVACLIEWPYDFHSHVQMFSEWKHGKFRMDDLKHPPGRWLVASKSIEQFFDMRRWNQWLAMPMKHGPMDTSPFVVHLSPSLFMSLYQEKSTGLVWPEITNYDSHYSDTDYSPPVSPTSPSGSPSPTNASGCSPASGSPMDTS